MISNHGSTTTSSSLSSPEFQRTILPSGIRVVTERINHVRSISVGVWLDVGSRDESFETNGISHFIEHMVFKGTKHYRLRQIAESLESIGGYLNAFTGKEQTCFYARILDQSLAKAMSVLSDMVQYPLFEKVELEKEKQVVLEELKNIEDDPDDLIHDYFDRAIFGHHPLSLPVIGRAETINTFNRDDLFSFMDKHYLSERMVVAAAGNLDHQKVVNLVEQHFQSLRKNLRQRRPKIKPGLHRTGRQVVHRPINQAHVCLGRPGYGIKSRHKYPLMVLNTALGEGMSSRLFQNIREKRGLAYSVYSFMNMMSDSGTFGVYIGTDKGKVEEAINRIHGEFEKLKAKPLGASELKRAKAQLKGTLMLGLESTSNRMMRLGGTEMYMEEHLPMDLVLKKIEEVTPEQVLFTANRLLASEKFSTVIFSPSSVANVQQ